MQGFQQYADLPRLRLRPLDWQRFRIAQSRAPTSRQWVEFPRTISVKTSSILKTSKYSNNFISNKKESLRWSQKNFHTRLLWDQVGNVNDLKGRSQKIIRRLSSRFFSQQVAVDSSFKIHVGSERNCITKRKDLSSPVASKTILTIDPVK
jgi:hypothetical protein